MLELLGQQTGAVLAIFPAADPNRPLFCAAVILGKCCSNALNKAGTVETTIKRENPETQDFRYFRKRDRLFRAGTWISSGGRTVDETTV